MNNHHIPDFNSIFQYTPGNYLVIKPNSPDFTIIAVNDQYLKVTLTKRDILGKKLFDVFPDNPADPHANGVATLSNSLETVIREKKPHEMAIQKFDIRTANKKDFETRYWLPKNTPVLNELGEVTGIIHNVADVTDSVAADKEIAHLKLKAQEIFMQAPIAIGIEKGSDYTIELANKHFLELIGKDTDAIGKPLLKVLPEIEGQGFIELMDKVRLEGKPYQADEIPITLIRNGKEEQIFVNFVYRPYRESDGTISGVLSIATEVTAQVSARKKVEESEAQLRNLIAEATVATGLYISPQMKIQYANEAMLKLWGKNADVIGKILSEALPELEGQPFIKLLSDVYTTGQTYWGKEDKAQLVVDGKLQDFFFNFTYKALRNSAGEIYGILNTAVDVTEQVVSKNKLIRSEERSRLAVEAAHLGTYEFNVINQTILHSSRTAEIFGYDGGQSLSHETIYKAIYPSDLPVRNKAHKVAAQTGQLFYQVRIILPDNSPRWIQVNGRLLFENNISEYIIGTVMDITVEKRNAEILEQKIKERTIELEEANELLRRSNGELEQIANAASHDLKEPLRKIRTFNQLIKKDSYGALSDRSKNHLDKSSEAAERMGSFLDALLEYTELKKPEQFTQVNLNETVSDVLNDLELVIGEKNATINCENLPIIRGIPHQLHQLFYNLVNNALKFSKDNVAPVIDISVTELDSDYITQYPTLKPDFEYIKITVKDNGIGFEEKHIGRIFTIFKRLHSKSAYKGTGIGLALCKKVALNHNGDVFASSSPDEGAAFYIILPIST